MSMNRHSAFAGVLASRSPRSLSKVPTIDCVTRRRLKAASDPGGEALVAENP